MRDYTEEEKSNNYQRLLEAIRVLKNGERITEDWMEEHKSFIQEFYEEFDYSLKNVSPDIESEEFRRNAINAHTLLTLMIDSIHTYKTFNLNEYLLFSETVLSMVTYTNDQSDFENLFSNLKVKEG